MQNIKLIRCVTRSILPSSKYTQIRCCGALPPNQVLENAKSSIPPGNNLDTPSPESNKVYAPHIEELVNKISKLNLIEVADLNSLLKKKLNISDAPMMAYGSMPAAAAPVQEEEAQSTVQEQSAFTVKLTAFDASKKVALIKEIKSIIEGMNLVQAKKFVESVPVVVKTDLTKDEAKELTEKLTAIGATTVTE